MSKNISVENARIMFRNFSGKTSMYNKNGRRSFSLYLTPEQAKDFSNDGWNVKSWVPKDSTDESDIIYHLPVSVAYEKYPPAVYLITSKKKTLLDEDTVGIIDSTDIKTVDLIISPYNWTVQDPDGGTKTGIKAYLKKMYVVVNEDEFDSKYNDLQDDDPSSLELPF